MDDATEAIKRSSHSTREYEALWELERRIDRLEQASQSPKLPWYRTPSNVFSFIAVSIALITATLGILKFIKDERESIAELRSEFVVSLAALGDIQLRLAQLGEVTDTIGIQTKEALEKMLDAQLSQSIEIADRLHDHVDPVQLEVHASNLLSAGRFPEAIEAYQLLLKMAASGREQLGPLVSLAQIFEIENRLNESRDFYQKALDAIASAGEFRVERARVQRSWACTEAAMSNFSEALLKIEHARAELPADPKEPRARYEAGTISQLKEYLIRLRDDGARFAYSGPIIRYSLCK